VSQPQWVEIEFEVIPAGSRAPTVPEDTQRVPYTCRVRGFFSGEAKVGECIAITTAIGRQVKGRLLRVSPPFEHGFGRPLVELSQAGIQARLSAGHHRSEMKGR